MTVITGRCPAVFLLAITGAIAVLAASFAADRTDGLADLDKARWRQELLAERAIRDQQMASSPTSMLAAVTQVWHKGSASLFFDASPLGIAYGEIRRPDAKLVMTLAGNYWEWQPLDLTAKATYRGKPAQPGRLEPGMRFDLLGRYILVIWSGLKGDLQLAVFDSERPALKNFKGLIHYPADERYLMQAEFARVEEPTKVSLLTNISGTRDFFRYGEIRFVIDGQPQRLTAYKERPDDAWLYIPFRDQTAGKTTYGAGRYMTAEEPGTETFILDFNRAMNIPCAYSPGFHCPLPPLENWLQAVVAAGEQTYPLQD